MAHLEKWPKEKKEKVTSLARAGLPVAVIAERYQTSRGAVYRILREMGV